MSTQLATKALHAGHDSANSQGTHCLLYTSDAADE